MSKPLRTLLRLCLYGLGIGVLAGTGLKFLDSAPIQGGLSSRQFKPLNILFGERSRKKKLNLTISDVTRRLKTNTFIPQKELKGLSVRWRELVSRQPDLKASALIINLDDGSFASVDANAQLPAASSIKAPILLVALQMLDSGELKWNEPLQLKKDLIGGGAGWMAFEPLGSTFPVHEVATEMIRVSDNTGTNLLISRIGGKEVLNRTFMKLGLSSTEIKNYLPDLTGTNTTSARDLVLAIALVDSGEALSIRSRDLFREVMSTSVSNRLIPGGLLKGLGGSQLNPDDGLLLKGYKVFNKTGDIGTAYVDVGLIEMPNNTRAIAAFIVTGPFNDPRSTQLIRDMAEAMAPVLRPKAELSKLTNTNF